MRTEEKSVNGSLYERCMAGTTVYAKANLLICVFDRVEDGRNRSNIVFDSFDRIKCRFDDMRLLAEDRYEVDL